MTDTQQVTAQYMWSSGVPPVAAGAFQSDSRNWSGARELYFSNADSQNQNLTPTFGALAVDDTVRVEQGGNPGNWRVWRVTGAAIQEADLTWTLPVESLDNAGTNVSNNQPCYLVFTLAVTAGQSLADWVMLTDAPSHWWSQITCIHGTTSAGVWTPGAIIDDRNLLAQAAPAFANHQSLLPDCDCALNIAWTPSFVPPAPPPPVKAEKQVAAQASTGTAAFSYQMMNAPSWYAGFVDCPLHGRSESGIWLGGPPPPMPFFQNIATEMLQNHQRILDGCTCAYAAIGPPQASMSITPQSGITPDASVALQQSVVGALPSGFSTDSYGRLCTTQDGLVSITASFFLARSVTNGAGGFGGLRCSDSSVPPLEGTNVLSAGMIDDDTPVATATLTYSAQLPAGTAFEVDYWNGSQLVEDVQGGSLVVMLQ